MGQVAVKFDDDDLAVGRTAVVQLKVPAAAGKPVLTVVPPSQDLAAILSLIGRAASCLASQRERADLLERRSLQAEKQLQAAQRKLADAEIRLGSAQDEAKTEKLRSAEVQRRSAEIVEKTRGMLAQAGDRLRAAETRAERAENSFATVQQAVERQIAPLLS